MINNEVTVILATITATIVVAFSLLLRAHLKRDVLPGDVRKEISDMHEWHNVNDENHVKVWYFTKQMKDTLNKLIEVMELTQQAQQMILQMQQRILVTLTEIQRNEKRKL